MLESNLSVNCKNSVQRKDGTRDRYDLKSKEALAFRHRHIMPRETFVIKIHHLTGAVGATFEICACVVVPSFFEASENVRDKQNLIRTPHHFCFVVVVVVVVVAAALFDPLAGISTVGNLKNKRVHLSVSIGSQPIHILPSRVAESVSTLR